MVARCRVRRAVNAAGRLWYIDFLLWSAVQVEGYSERVRRVKQRVNVLDLVRGGKVARIGHNVGAST